MKIGDKIKALRLSRKLTLEELATRISTTKQTVYKYENNLITNIPSDKIELLATVLNTTPAYLMGWENIDVNTQRPVNEIRFALQGKLDKLSDEELEEMSILADLALKRRNNK